MTDSESPITNRESPLFILVAGEASGDLLGADLMASLRERIADARFAGIGGPRMIAAGMEAWYPAEKLSVMGLVEVLKHLPQLLAIRRDVYRRTLHMQPAAFIGIDAPDFNLDLERKLKRRGVRTAHYVSPSVWAWREKRAAKIGASADRMLCLFPMEPAIYARHGVAAQFVGHPLADAFALEPDQAAARRELGLALDTPVLALLPGSRLGEIRRLGGDFLQAATLLKQQLPNLQIVAPMANAQCRAVFEQFAGASACRIIDGHSHAAMLAADAVLLASGTAALEAMLAKRPMVVAYRLAPLTHWIVKSLRMLRTDVYSLPNILAGRRIVPELMQQDCRPAALAEALLPQLRARTIAPDLLAEFRRLHQSLRGDALHNAAAAVADMIRA
jgi:lipid-A-disaccharide synthase